MVKISKEDMAIVSVLREDARASFSKIAQTLDMPESTARHRTNKLVQNGILDVEAVVNPQAIGFDVWMSFNIVTELKKIDDVAKRLAEFPEIYFVALRTGREHIVATGVFTSNDACTEFMIKSLGKIDGVSSVDSFSITQVYKRKMSLVPQTPHSGED